MIDLAQLPVLGICGFSGAGKTTLLLDLVRLLARRGLRTLVIKHDAHGLDVDRRGKDTQRAFAAGADVLARDHTQSFTRSHDKDTEPLAWVLWRQSTNYDAILVEGHKSTPLPRRIWLRRDDNDGPPSNFPAVDLDLGRKVDRLALAWPLVERQIAEAYARTPVYAGILIGGRSTRMGCAKHLLRLRGQTWIEHIAMATAPLVAETVVLGSGMLPQSLGHLMRLPDAPDHQGPLAGIVAAMRWQPRARWLFAACDTPLLNHDALTWIVAQGCPGVWAVLPRRRAESPPEPFPGLYDFRALSALEDTHGPSHLAGHPAALTPTIPARLRAAWRNLNTPRAAKSVSTSVTTAVGGRQIRCRPCGGSEKE